MIQSDRWFDTAGNEDKSSCNKHSLKSIEYAFFFLALDMIHPKPRMLLVLEKIYDRMYDTKPLHCLEEKKEDPQFWNLSFPAFNKGMIRYNIISIFGQSFDGRKRLQLNSNLRHSGMTLERDAAGRLLVDIIQRNS